jgi:hypothetical protein
MYPEALLRASPNVECTPKLCFGDARSGASGYILLKVNNYRHMITGYFPIVVQPNFNFFKSIYQIF